jgi:hypothetical protein
MDKLFRTIALIMPWLYCIHKPLAIGFSMPETQQMYVTLCCKRLISLKTAAAKIVWAFSFPQIFLVKIQRK